MRGPAPRCSLRGLDPAGPRVAWRQVCVDAAATRLKTSFACPWDFGMQPAFRASRTVHRVLAGEGHGDQLDQRACRFAPPVQRRYTSRVSQETGPCRSLHAVPRWD
jgi:hypothetical protein